MTDAAKDPKFDPTVQQQLDNLEVQLLISILERWHVSRRFPVIDLARLVCAFSPGAYAGDGEGAAFFRALFVAAEWEQDWTAPLSKQRDTNVLLVLRAIANAAQYASNSDWVPVVRVFSVSLPIDSRACSTGSPRTDEDSAPCSRQESSSRARNDGFQVRARRIIVSYHVLTTACSLSCLIVNGKAQASAVSLAELIAKVCTASFQVGTA